jgi:hypothetical protein
MKHSIGKNLTAGVSNTLITVPAGYIAVVSMLFISNAGNNTKSVAAAWNNGTTITFQSAKSVSSGELLQFGGEFGYFLVLSGGDSITVTPEADSTFTAIISFDLERQTPSRVVF